MALNAPHCLMTFHFGRLVVTLDLGEGSFAFFSLRLVCCLSEAPQSSSPPISSIPSDMLQLTLAPDLIFFLHSWLTFSCSLPYREFALVPIPLLISVLIDKGLSSRGFDF